MHSRIANAESRTYEAQRIVSANHNRSYEVRMVDDLLGKDRHLLTEQLKDRRCLMVATPTVDGLYGEQLTEALRSDSIDITKIVLPVREETKNIENVLEICRQAQKAKLGRQSILIGLGGGVCTDLVTMAAQLLRRGIPYIRIPTTLLGQVDGSIGVKGAVNFGGRKNSLGCYYSPKAVFVDPTMLRSLQERQLSLGVSEIIKMAIVRDTRLFELVEKTGLQLIRSRFQKPRQTALEVSQRAIYGMIEELETNLYEDRSYQRLVDFGHTVGPALEAASDFSTQHGDAVAISMAFCCVLARELQLLDDISCERVLNCLDDCDLPTYSPLLTPDLIQRSFGDATRHRAGQLNLVLPTRIGAAQFIEYQDQVPTPAIERAVQRLRSAPGTDPSTPTIIRFQPSAPCLVYDVGGTNTRAAIYDAEQNRLLKRSSRPTQNHRRRPNLAPSEILGLVKHDMDELAEELLDGVPPSQVSVAFAGPLNDRNHVTAAPTIWGTTNGPPIDLLSELRLLWPSPTIQLLNDVTASGYRYLKHASESLCVITVGSGIGNKIFVNGKPTTGPNGRGGEIGHIVVDHSESAIECDCGGRGHLGGIASGRGTLATAKRWAEKDPDGFGKSLLTSMTAGGHDSLDNTQIVEAFHKQDEWTHEVIRYVAGKLGNVIASIHQSIGIERFVIFGGFAISLGETYRRYLVDAASNDCWNAGQDWDSMIELGVDDDDCGLLGAGRFAMEFV